MNYHFLEWVAKHWREARRECPENTLALYIAYHRDTGMVPPNCRIPGFRRLANEGARLIAAGEKL